MFPSSSFGGVDPFPYPDLYPNSTPKQQLVLPLSSHYPFPFLDNEFFWDHFISPSQSLLLPCDTPSMAVSIPSNDKQTTKQSVMKSNDVQLDKETLGKGNGSGNGPKKENPKRRGSKTDRHSKICTRHGPRDRRMRLSLKIARRFFDLQDLLGFDKASKTIDWLFNHSKAAIKEVAGKFDTTLDLGPDQNLMTSSSKRKAALESSREAATSNANLEQENVFGRSNELLMLVNKSSDASNKTSDELGLQLQHTAKYLRTQARERARERTRKRKLIRSLENSEQDNSGNANPNFSVHVGPAVVEDTTGTSCSKKSNQVMGKTSTSGSLAMLNNSLEFSACSRGQRLGNINLFDYFGNWNNVDVTRSFSNDGAMSCSASFTGNAPESPSSYLHPHSSFPPSFQGN